MIKYDAYNRTEPSRIYIARPGKRILGVLNGIDEESCNLNLKFIDASELSFDIYKYIDGEKSNYYDHVDILMEIYVDGYGWFYIDESPTIHNDSIKEYKSVNAKSYESILRNYDLVGFDINTASDTSREMLATDNVYTYHTTSEVWYNLFRDRVLFYRDSSQHKALLDEIEQDATFQDLQELLSKYPKVLLYDWRIEIAIDSNLRDAFVTMKDNSESSQEMAFWQNCIDNYDSSTGMTSSAIKEIALLYPEIVTYITLIIDKTKYDFDDITGEYKPTKETHTARQLMEMEYKRIRELSLLDLVISDIPGWSIGEVDRNLYPEHSDVYGTQLLLQDEVGRFEVDSQDVYSFLITELAGYFNCVFIFNTIDNTINAYRIESVGTDTKIFLGFRNVQNSVDITPSQELFTRFTVENSDGLGITYVNFGQREIDDISYFLNTKYLSQDLIDKYKYYLSVRERYRADYIELSRQYNKKYNKAQEIYNRVPSDMLNLSQLDNYTSQDQLKQVIDNYYALMIGILNGFIYVSTDEIDPPGDIDLYDDYNDYIDDMNNYIDELMALVDVGKDIDATPFENSLYYKDFYMMKEFTVPNLVIAYNNLSLPSYETKEDYYDAFEYDFRDEQPGYGWLYGIAELKAFQKSHLDKMNVYKDYELAWSSIPDTQAGREFKAKYTEAYYTSLHNLYTKYYNGYISASTALERRTDEYNSVIHELEEIDESRHQLADSLKLENFSENGLSLRLVDPYGDCLYTYEDDDDDEIIDKKYLTVRQGGSPFTEEEIEQINRLYKHTDYINDNINYLDYIDTTDDVIDKQLEMYNEAINELYVESHPQYSYSSSVDDLLANNEYELYHPEFKVGNFIRLGLDDSSQVRLRMISVSFNPMIYDDKIDIEFSNMIQYKSKRNDFVSLIDSALTSAKNSINARYNRESDSDNTVQVTYDLVQKILQSSAFSNATKNIQSSSVNTISGTFQTLATGYLKTNELAAEVANITELHSDSAFVNYLESNLVVARSLKADSATISGRAEIADLATEALSAQSADIADLATESLSSRYIDAVNIDTSNLTAQSAFITYLNTNLVVANAIQAQSASVADLATDSLSARSVDASNINVDSLIGDSALFNYLESNLVVASEIDVDDLRAKLATIDHLDASSAFVSFLETDITTARSLTADTADLATVATNALTAGSIQAENIQTDTITSTSGFYQYLQSVSSTTATSVINDAYIYNAVAGKISVADLSAGTIVLTDQMTIVSQNENGGNVLFDGDALQFTDSDGNVGIEIGYGSQSYPHIIITDENGTSLWTSTGITSNGIGDSIIYGRMINDDTISKEKLNFPIVDTDEDGNISITNVLDAEGGSFGVEYENFKETTESSISGISSVVDNVNQSITNKIWQSDIDAYDSSTVQTIRDRTSLVEQELGKIILKVTDVIGTTNDIGNRLTTAESEIRINADSISSMVTVNGQASSFTLTDKMIQAITNQFVVTGSDGDTTVISGGYIQADSIQASDMSVDAIRSRNYSAPLTQESRISTSGTFLDLANGDIYSPILGINTINRSGKLSGLNINSSSIYSGNKNTINSPENGFFLDNIGQMNIGDEYNYVLSWYDTEEARWRIVISADSIMLGTGESVADIAKNATRLIYDHDYEIFDDHVTFEAHLYKNGEDLRNFYDAYNFNWYIKNDDGMTLFGQGYTIDIPIENFKYGGSVVGRFIDDDIINMVDSLGNTLVSSDNDTIIAYKNTLPNR